MNKVMNLTYGPGTRRGDLQKGCPGLFKKRIFPSGLLWKEKTGRGGHRVQWLLRTAT